MKFNLLLTLILLLPACVGNNRLVTDSVNLNVKQFCYETSFADIVLVKFYDLLERKEFEEVLLFASRTLETVNQSHESYCYERGLAYYMKASAYLNLQDYPNSMESTMWALLELEALNMQYDELYANCLSILTDIEKDLQNTHL